MYFFGHICFNLSEGTTSSKPNFIDKREVRIQYAELCSNLEAKMISSPGNNQDLGVSLSQTSLPKVLFAMQSELVLIYIFYYFANPDEWEDVN